MKLRKPKTAPALVIGRDELIRETADISKGKMRIKALTLILAVLLLVGLGAFASSAIAANARSFPILLDRNAPEVASISLSESPEFEEPTVHLDAPVTSSFTNISGFTIPENIDGDYSGSHNGSNYIAYTYYLKNNGETDCDLNERMNILYSGNNADAAVRVKVYRNGVDTTYAKASADGMPEVGTIPFFSEDAVFDEVNQLPAGRQCKYTIVIWLEGDDPDCTDAIKGGSVRFSMEFAAAGQ